ncbi:hypothetical protein ALI22I_03080 [Saccharothrix sp. ALI-22-I]|nr:hypothetical protein ALI22I_03080 [Saccharothrix sp. ALI-22-I]
MGNYTTSVRPFASSVSGERTLDLRFDWKTAIAGDAMKTGMELRDDSGRLVFAIAATASELRYAVTGPESDSTSAPDSLNPTWIRTGFDRAKWYTVDLHLDFALRRIQYSITSKEAAPTVVASGTASITGTNLARLVACNYYGTGTQSIDNFRLVRPDHSAYGSLAGKSVYAFGDSIVFGHQYSRSFLNFVAEREGMTLTKYARNGATVGPSNASGGRIITQVQSAGAQAPDFVVFDGGTNDAIEVLNHAYGIGTVSDSQDPATFDTGTYTGSLETIIHAMKQKWPTARLVYVAAHKLGSRDWNTQLALRQVTLQAAGKWGIAVADVFADTTFDTRVDAQRVAYTFDVLVGGYPGSGGSGTHPNIAGITDFYVPVLTRALVELVRGPVSGATYKIRNAASGRYLDTELNGVVTLAPKTTYDDQDWIVTKDASGYWTIKNVRTGRHYLDADATGNSVIWNSGTIVDDSLWSIGTGDNGVFHIRNKRPDRAYLYATPTNELKWNTGSTDSTTDWVFERK